MLFQTGDYSRAEKNMFSVMDKLNLEKSFPVSSMTLVLTCYVSLLLFMYLCIYFIIIFFTKTLMRKRQIDASSWRRENIKLLFRILVKIMLQESNFNTFLKTAPLTWVNCWFLRRG